MVTRPPRPPLFPYTTLFRSRAAVEEGIVPGGGTALIRCLAAVEKLKLHDDEAVGAGIVKRALEEPARQIAHNAGSEGAVVIDRKSTRLNSSHVEISYAVFCL